MVNINTPVNVVHSKSTDNTDIYTLNFDGVTAQLDHVRPNNEQLDWFKKGVLAERERIWDEGSHIDDNVLTRLLNK